MAPTGDPDNDNMVVGAFEEIGQIEWPTPGAALTTTGIVIAMATASTFVLLSVNSGVRGSKGGERGGTRELGDFGWTRLETKPLLSFPPRRLLLSLFVCS